ncbi:retinal guanylyl cyclase 2-like isoform X2 [Drosophila subobscura]|uniref:retinal guanylyl cyclase 2-like isoform X2 n=1 Tax=Drosophila subobscura TaxID=7241 RepID=UPI00155AEE9D|nr:retinal guanylyl cyclase 2-like isoform X2 [Drosophila subobscura]
MIGLLPFFVIILVSSGIDSSQFHCVNNNDITSQEPKIHELEIGLQTTNRPLHQVITRIFFMFLKDVLGYRNIRIIPINSYNAWTTLDLVRRDNRYPNISMINIQAWMPYTFGTLPENVLSAGASMTLGRFGWFVPKTQQPKDVFAYQSLHYEIFQNVNHTYYDLYVLEDSVLNGLLKIRSALEYRNPNCVGYKCATILAEFRNDSSFVEDQLIETGMMVNVLWLGERFRETIEWLIKEYEQKFPDGSKRLVILHWTPSEIIADQNAFQQITMPRCEDFNCLQRSGCKYELTPILKYYAKRLATDKQLMHVLRYFNLSDKHLAYIRKGLKYYRQDQSVAADEMYDKVACHWLLTNKNYYNLWKESNQTITLLIGGIFPINITNRGHENVMNVAKQAASAINKDQTILPGYNLEILVNNGQCKSDMVMKSFIHYYSIPNMLGVLGPACSETVEPIAGISKHMNMMIMSYSAEGASFSNRQAYPYFYRTIGTNRLFVDAYIAIMEQFKWTRVASITEDESNDNTSQMEKKLKLRNFTLVINRKLQAVVTPTEMKEHLHKLKEVHAKIITADIQINNAAILFCEAHKLGMTQRDDYVWFLPTWLPKDFRLWENIVNRSCTASELRNAIEGHFSVRHTPFGNPDAVMQEGKPIRAWLEQYRNQSGEPSNYAGFTYDAVWAYALAAHKLLLKDQYAVNYLRNSEIVNRFSELIEQTDFEGLSGHVSFAQGELAGSRLIDLDILQWKNASYVQVGKFKPITKGKGDRMHMSGGNLSLSFNNILWLKGLVPEDGRYDCQFSGLARTFRVNCETAAMVFAIVFCLLAISLISFISFWFWKKRYSHKLKRSAQIMKMFGIDLLSPSQNKMNTLDKWEIPKENVVVNRRLGEGAFGMVYGGEAQITSGHWTAVAVKTLKSGQSMEDRLDFLSEAEAMKKFDHKNIIKLLGVCLQSEPIYTVMEFMLYGDLKTYLLARRNMVKEKITDDSDISAKRLTLYAMDIACGLAYLSEKKYVHRDIALRNCLVNAQRVVKIADFGMARPTFESDYYRFNRKGVRKLFPVRWMPPETLVLGLFTPASDIWSFGVVLYEVITFGSYPYQGLTNNQVLEYVKNGKTMHIPFGVKPPLEGLLKACWSQEASKRPTALEVVEYISSYPRLLTPTLDVPATSIDLADSQSDKINECGIRELSNLTISANTYTEPDTIYKPLCDTGSFTPITPDGYSIMSPLLAPQTNEKPSSFIK